MSTKPSRKSFCSSLERTLTVRPSSTIRNRRETCASGIALRSAATARRCAESTRARYAFAAELAKFTLWREPIEANARDGKVAPASGGSFSVTITRASAPAAGGRIVPTRTRGSFRSPWLRLTGSRRAEAGAAQTSAAIRPARIVARYTRS